MFCAVLWNYLVLSSCSSITGNLPVLTDAAPNATANVSDSAAPEKTAQSASAENAKNLEGAAAAGIAPRIKPAPAKTDAQRETAPIPEKLSSLLGLSDVSITDIFGRPHEAEENGASIIWNYTTSKCSLQIVFYPDIEDETYHALQYALTDGNGESPEDSRPCLDHIQSTNSHGGN
jgi:hypothetical protein